MSQTFANSDQNFDEDSCDTLKRQLFSIAEKVKYTLLMIPGDRQTAIQKLRNWDLWGPLLICFIFTIAIGIQAQEQYVYDSFANVFLIFWIGSFLASLNCRLLGKQGSIFQTISIIGYCMIPLAVFGFIVSLLPNSTPSFINLLLVLLGLVWSLVSCVIVMGNMLNQSDEQQGKKKKFLCVYPIFLFYIFLAWYAIVA